MIGCIKALENQNQPGRKCALANFTFLIMILDSYNIRKNMIQVLKIVIRTMINICHLKSEKAK